MNSAETTVLIPLINEVIEKIKQCGREEAMRKNSDMTVTVWKANRNFCCVYFFPQQN